MLLKILTLIIAGTFFMSGSSSDEVEERANPWEKSNRIPLDIIPVKYDLIMDPDIEAGNFKGEVTVLINITAPRDWIPIHIKNLNISKTVMTNKDGKPVKVSEAFKYPRHQFWIIKTEKVQPGLFKLNLNFTGSLIENISGFYRSIYHENGTSTKIATTKFEPVDARQAFPCFDEPALKAKFTIHIVKPREKYTALSNMNIMKEEVGPMPDKVTVHFHETLPMSTYLVCFVISDFKDSGAVNVENMGKPFAVRIFASPGQVQNTNFARNVASSVSKFYIEYFGIAYALPKLDLIAIPDFVSGAMENWGLITFRETSLLYNEKENSAEHKQRVAIVVSHEVAHQWFGNLVTMKWWNDLWLNEGFASFMQYKALEEGVPDCRAWQAVDHGIYEQIYPVLKRDALTSSHPIIQNVDNPNQINEVFDSISYNKGHAVIKMVEGFMGKVAFKKGIQKYLRGHEYSSATTADLWSCLTKEISTSKANVSEVMETWTLQMGYPVVNVEKVADGWQLTQGRFMADKDIPFDPSDSPYGYTWDIPIHYLTDSSQPNFAWFKRNQKAIKIPRPTNRNFIKINFQQIGFYRVNYDMESWRILENMLKTAHESMDRKDRANLLDDSFSLASSGSLNYAIPLDLVGYVKREKEFLPWAAAHDALVDISDRLYSSSIYAPFRKFLVSLVRDMYGAKENQFSFTVGHNDSHQHRQLRVKFLDLACQAGLPLALQDATTKFGDWIKKPTTPVHPDVRGLVFYYGMRVSGNEYEWDIVWDRYLKEVNPQEKINLLQSLTSIREPWLLSRLLEFSKNESFIRSQDFFQALTFMANNPVGTPIVWRFFRNEWPYLVQRFSLYSRSLGTFLSAIANRFSTQVELEELEAFIDKYPDAGAGAASRKVAVERIRVNILWKEKNELPISKWLSKNNFL